MRRRMVLPPSPVPCAAVRFLDALATEYRPLLRARDPAPAAAAREGPRRRCRSRRRLLSCDCVDRRGRRRARARQPTPARLKRAQRRPGRCRARALLRACGRGRTPRAHARVSAASSTAALLFASHGSASRTPAVRCRQRPRAFTNGEPGNVVRWCGTRAREMLRVGLQTRRAAAWRDELRRLFVASAASRRRRELSAVARGAARPRVAREPNGSLERGSTSVPPMEPRALALHRASAATAAARRGHEKPFRRIEVPRRRTTTLTDPEPARGDP